MAERAVGHLEELRGFRPDSARAFQSAQQIRALKLRDVLFEVKAALGNQAACRFLWLALGEMVLIIHGDAFGKAFRRIFPPRSRPQARSIVFSSSRTFPGQS